MEPTGLQFGPADHRQAAPRREEGVALDQSLLRQRDMEASSSRSRSGGLPSKRRSSGGGSGSGSGYGPTAQSLNDDTLRSIFSRLDDHFDLAHCSAVCKSWSDPLRGSSLTFSSRPFPVSPPNNYRLLGVASSRFVLFCAKFTLPV
jgi:hypothetical protein